MQGKTVDQDLTAEERHGKPKDSEKHVEEREEEEQDNHVRDSKHLHYTQGRSKK